MISILSPVILRISGFLAAAVIILCLFLPAQTSAQSSLQTTGGSLQPQSSQTQNTNNSQGQTGSPQSSGNQSVLSGQNTQPLGVFSSPQQSSPDAFAQTNTELRSNSNEEPQDSGLPTAIKFLLGFLAVFLIVFFVAYRFSRLDFEESFGDEQADINTSTERPERQRIKRLKKKRRKPHQR
jgi:hypothetical protein